MDLPHLRLLALGLSLILLVGVAWRLQGWRTRRLAHKPASTQSSSPRPLKPKTAHDCPECRAAQASGETVTAARVTPMPWRLRKGIGGRKKRLATAGYFCPNPACEYYLVSDAAIHALVGYGVHGKHEPIQDLWCQCCRRKFPARRHTVLYRLKTLSRTVAQALTLLVVGMDASAVEEV